jgi:hypothetical protein
MNLFAGFDGQHGTHGVPDLDPNGVKWAIKRTAKTIKKPVTVAMWQEHIDGKRPLGIIPIRADSTCLWGSIDIDQYDLDLTAVVRRVEERSLPLVPCRSKSGGLHLFIFFAEPVDAAEAQGTLRDLAASLGFAGCEIFPKQTKILVEHGDQGNWIVMPYFGSDYGGKLKMQHGIKKTGAEMTIGEFLTLAEKRRVTEDQLADLMQPSSGLAPAIVTNGSGKKKPNGSAESTPRHKLPYGDGPPCLTHLAASGFPEGGRNNALFHIGVYLKKAHPANWKDQLELDNQAHMKPPLPPDEVEGIIKSLNRKDYEYKCKDQPMVSHCNSVVCRGRKHGVGVGGTYPEILGIDKLDIEPPVWFVQIPGGHRIPMTTDDLQNYRRFHKLCMATANVCYKMIPEPVWFSIIGEAMQKVKEIPAPEDIGMAGVFLEMLETFLTNRMRGKQKEDLLRGAPWEDEEAGRHYFQLAPLEKFLQREGVRDVNRPTLKYRIEALNGGHRQMNIKGRNRYVWWVPSNTVQNAPELDPPEAPKEIL